MKLIIQRVTEAAVTINGSCTGAIGPGYMVLVGCCTGDSEKDVQYLAQKLTGLRIFTDDQGKMNLSIQQTDGSVLLVSQFTLYADTQKGNRPGFARSGNPALAEVLFDSFVLTMRTRLGTNRVATGVFGADMQVSLVNDGPVTIELCSDSQPWHT